MSSFPWAKRGTLRPRATKAMCLCVRFSNDDSLIGATHFDGTVVVTDLASLTTKLDFNIASCFRGSVGAAPANAASAHHPATSLAFRPVGKPIFIVTSSSGMIYRFDSRTGECLTTILEKDNEIYACDYRPDGTMFATVGRDALIRVYDDLTGKLQHVLNCAAELASTPPAERLYSVRFSHSNPSWILSAGWSGSANVFDLHNLVTAGGRAATTTSGEEFFLPPKEPGQTDEEYVALLRAVAPRPNRYIFGPYITGDAMDISSNGWVFAASHRVEAPRLSMWQLDRVMTAAKDHSGAAVEPATEIPWPAGIPVQFVPECAKISSNGDLLAVAGTNGQQVKSAAFVYDRSNGKVLVDFKSELHSINSCHFSQTEGLVAFADGEGSIHIFENRVAGNQHRRPRPPGEGGATTTAAAA